MTLFEVVILGIVQGLTEFLPISSSGHLVLVQSLFGISEGALVLDIVLHWGTLFAVAAFYRNDLIQITKDTAVFFLEWLKHPAKRPSPLPPNVRLGFMLVLATLPAVVAAVLFDEAIEKMFSSVTALVGAWILTGVFILFSSRFPDRGRPLAQMTVIEALLIGVAQAVAIIPAVSRSGATIVAAMACGLDKNQAARFSFLMSVPAILGAGVLKFGDGAEQIQGQALEMLSGFTASLAVGYFSIWFLLRLIQKGKLFYFGYYCIAIALVTGIYMAVTGVS